MTDSMYRITVGDHLGGHKCISGSGSVHLYRLDGSRAVGTTEGAPKSADHSLVNKTMYSPIEVSDRC